MEESESAPSTSTARNPTGKNQYTDCCMCLHHRIFDTVSTHMSYSSQRRWEDTAAPDQLPSPWNYKSQYHLRFASAREPKYHHEVSKYMSEVRDAELIPWCSSTSVGQRLRMLGLFASGATMKGLPETAKRQLVLDEIGKDPLGKLGPRTVKDNIRDETGIHLMR